MPDPLIPIAKVAERLGTSERHVREIVRRGDLSVVRVGRLLRFQPAAVDAFIANQTSDRSQR